MFETKKKRRQKKSSKNNRKKKEKKRKYIRTHILKVKRNETIIKNIKKMKNERGRKNISIL